MSALASFFIGVPNTAVAPSAAKPSAKLEDGGFLSVLAAGAPAGIEGDVKKSLVDALYEKEPVPDPVAAPVQLPTQLFVDNKKSGEDLAPNSAAPRDVDARDKAVAAPDEAKSEQQARPNQANDVVKKNDDVRPTNNQTNAVSKPDKTNISQNAAPVKPAPKEDALSDISKEISDKIEQLTALLSSIAALLAAKMQGTTQLSITNVSVQVRGVGADFASAGSALSAGLASASEQLNALLAFMQGAAGANMLEKNNLLTGVAFQAVEATTSLTFQAVDFQSLSFNGANWQQQCQACEVKIGQMISLAQSNTAGFAANDFGGEEISSLADMFSQLKQNLGDLHKLLAQRSAILDATASTTSSNVPAANISANEGAALVASDVPAAVVPTVVTAAVDNKTAQPQLLAAGANGVVVAQEALASGGNSAGANSQNQGGERGFSAAPVATAAGSQTSSQASTVSFSKLLSQSAQVPVFEQVAVHIKTLPKDGSSKIEIQLDPESLGKVQIKMNVDSDGNTNLVVTADNKQTLDLLQRDARGLQQALSDAGLKADGGSLNFNLRGGEQQKEQQASSTYQKLQPEEEDLVPLAVVSRSYVVNMHDGLNIKI